MSEKNPTVTVTADAEMSPEQLAEVFWEMDNHQQADFFSHLDKIAGTKLCFQMSALAETLIEQSRKGDHSGRNAFECISDHATSLWKTAIDRGCRKALNEIQDMARNARGDLQIGSRVSVQSWTDHGVVVNTIDRTVIVDLPSGQVAVDRDQVKLAI